MPTETFEVDTHLFRELGELLVGRNSTALVELIKNAYDADATRIVIAGSNLGDTRRGRITVADNGIGMGPEQFRQGFLTIAGRLKDSSQRKSLKFKRRYTGAKGIGRLAAHKLAKFIKIESCPDPAFVSPGDEILHATIDWDIIETKTLFREIAESDAVNVETQVRPNRADAGTTITLKRLRKKWTASELVQFQAEIESYRPPPTLVSVPERIVNSQLLFQEPKVAEVGQSDKGIEFELTGDFDTGEDFWPQVADSAHWLIEVDASARRKPVAIRISPTRLGKREMPDAQVGNFRDEHPGGDSGPRFQARIFIREGGAGNRAFKQWISRSYGVRVYNEGFRVLPYGEPNNDWLSLDADYKTRPKTLSYLESKGFEPSSVDENEGLVFLGNSGYFGAVFLTTSGAPDLRMLVNREGFVADPSFDHVISIMRTAIYLSVRVRAAAKRKSREQRREQRQGKPQPRVEIKQAVESAVSRATDFAREARQLAAEGNIAAATEKIDEAVSQFTQGAEAHGRLMTEGSILRVLASVGTQMAAFVHEINGILGMAKALESAVSAIEAELKLSAAQRKNLVHLRSAIEDLRRGIERQASYLTDVVSPDARRRRSRQRLGQRFDAGCRLVAASAARRGIVIENKIPADLKSPPMFPAELTVVFSNLLTNAIKAADTDGRIRVTGRENRDGVSVKLENTGTVVNLDTAERWFQPFESTTVETDPVLGQGMGMGLPITRNLLEEYGASIRFAAPSRDFATAVEIIFPK